MPAPSATVLTPAPGDNLTAAIDGADPALPVVLQLTHADLYTLAAAPVWPGRGRWSIVPLNRGTRPVIADLSGAYAYPRLVAMTRPATVPADLGTSMLGTLDATASGKTGVRLRPGQRIQGGADGVSLRVYRAPPYPVWDGWKGVRQFTLSFAAVFHTAQSNAAPLLGLDATPDATPTAAPVALRSSLHVNALNLLLSFTDGTTATLSWPSGNYLVPLYEGAVDFDLDAGTAHAWAGSTPQAVTVTGSLAGKTLMPNASAPFCLNGDADVTWCGVCLQYQPVYAPGSNPRARIDGATDNHLKRYFTDGTKLQGDPVFWSDPVAHKGAWVAFYDQTGTHSLAAYLDGSEGDASKGIADVTVSGIEVRSGNGTGRGLAWGNIARGALSQGLVLDDCRMTGGAHGAGTVFGAQASYLVQVNGGVYDGADACLHARKSNIDARGLSFGAGGRTLLRLEGCSGDVHVPMTFLPVDWAECYAYVSFSDDPADLDLRMDVDDEVDRTAFGAFLGALVVDQPHLGKADLRVRNRFDVPTPGAPAVLLRGASLAGTTAGDCVLTLPARPVPAGKVATSAVPPRWSVVTGPPGPKGDKGDPGATGPPGASNVVVVGGGGSAAGGGGGAGGNVIVGGP